MLGMPPTYTTLNMFIGLNSPTKPKSAKKGWNGAGAYTIPFNGMDSETLWMKG